MAIRLRMNRLLRVILLLIHLGLFGLNRPQALAMALSHQKSPLSVLHQPHNLFFPTHQSLQYPH